MLLFWLRNNKSKFKHKGVYVFMKSFKKILIMSTAFLGMALTACNGGGNTNSSEEPAPQEGPQVYVLTGQSNMEGNTRFTQNDLNTPASTMGLIYCCGRVTTQVR